MGMLSLVVVLMSFLQTSHTRRLLYEVVKVYTFETMVGGGFELDLQLFWFKDISVCIEYDVNS